MLSWQPLGHIETHVDAAAAAAVQGVVVHFDVDFKF